MRWKYQHVIFVIILVVYLVTRLSLISEMNEYVDYDEGTYLLMARLINQGYLPYRDIFAVHPPLYYYLLALWLRIFGDNYITGRMLSVLFGVFSVVLAYLIGKELKDNVLGILYSIIIILDPTLIEINRLVLHDTLIEFFVLFSLYYFVKYLKLGNPKYAYLSLVLAGTGSTVKFTIIPYLAALYVTLVFTMLDKTSWEYVKSGIKVVLSRKQVFVVMALYSFLAALFVSLRMAWPSTLTKYVLVVLGIHPVDRVGHKYVGAIMFSLWSLLTIYVFRAQYVEKLIYVTKSILKNFKISVLLFLAAITPKVIIEGTLGYSISPDFLSQTYLLQSGRYYSFVGVFDVIGDVNRYLSGDSQELAYTFVPLFALLFVLIVTIIREESPKEYSDLNGPLRLLLVLNLFMYLMLFPIIPIVRFILPLILVVYLSILRLMVMFNPSKRKIFAGVVLLITVLSLLDYGFITNVPSGKLSIAWGVHSGDLRDDAKAYLELNPCESLYSINPMNTYYLNATTPPMLVDSFGLLYVAGESLRWFETELENSTDCVVTSTWMEGAIEQEGDLNRVYTELKTYLLTNWSLEFSESYSDGDVISIFRQGTSQRNLTLITQNGELVLWMYSKGDLLYITTNRSYGGTKKVLLEKLQDGSILIKWYAGSSKLVEVIDAEVSLDHMGKTIRITHLNGTGSLILKFNGTITDFTGRVVTKPSDYKVLNIYTHGTKITLQAKKLRVQNLNTIEIVPESPVEIRVGN